MSGWATCKRTSPAWETSSVLALTEFPILPLHALQWPAAQAPSRNHFFKHHAKRMSAPGGHKSTSKPHLHLIATVYSFMNPLQYCPYSETRRARRMHCHTTNAQLRNAVNQDKEKTVNEITHRKWGISKSVPRTPTFARSAHNPTKNELRHPQEMSWQREKKKLKNGKTGARTENEVDFGTKATWTEKKIRLAYDMIMKLLHSIISATIYK